MADTDGVKSRATGGTPGGSSPLCPECLMPVDPVTFYCSNCGESASGASYYIPHCNYARQRRANEFMFRNIRSYDLPLLGWLIRLVLVIVSLVFFPITLILIFFVRRGKSDG